jgi:transcription-repair coupling factor (superfamily II helicase)
MRDLEMRGAGDVLGVRQHGQIAAVGFHLYTRLLGEAVKKLKSPAPTAKAQMPTTTSDQTRTELGIGNWDLGFSITVDLPLPTSIPSEYVGDKSLRLRLYRRLADIRDEAGVEAVGAELAERFGPLPAPVENLLYQLRVKIRAGRAGVTGVGSDSGQIVITLPVLNEKEEYVFGTLGAGVRVSKNKIWLARATSEGDWRAQLLEVLARLAAEGLAGARVRG